MGNRLRIVVNKERAGELSREYSEYVFSYDSESDSNAFISLTMPVRVKSYTHDQLPPIFEMHLPEGYLLSIIKKHFSKLVETDDFGLLQILVPSVRGRLEYSVEPSRHYFPLYLEDLLTPSHPNLFDELVLKFALSTPLSGVQPKVLARVENKATLKLEDYIVKAWGAEYPELALNEFLCMQAVKKAGINVPEFYLSSDEKLFIMKRFDLCDDGTILGFEDMCVLQAKQRDDKYKGSYEQVAKSIQLFTSRHLRFQSLEQFFKMIVMNTLLQNGDAHLKNFGVLYQNSQEVQLSPAYDIVSTTLYVKRDIPALTLFGSKRWHKKKLLINFGVTSCFLTQKQALSLYKQCLVAMASLHAVVTQRLVNEENLDKRKLLLHLQTLAKNTKNHCE